MNISQQPPYSITLAVAQTLTDDELLDALRSDRLKGEDARQYAYSRVGYRYQNYARKMMGG